MDEEQKRSGRDGDLNARRTFWRDGGSIPETDGGLAGYNDTGQDSTIPTPAIVQGLKYPANFALHSPCGKSPLDIQELLRNPEGAIPGSYGAGITEVY